MQGDVCKFKCNACKADYCIKRQGHDHLIHFYPFLALKHSTVSCNKCVNTRLGHNIKSPYFCYFITDNI